MTRIALIGAGSSGLATALELAKGGAEVLLLEALPTRLPLAGFANAWGPRLAQERAGNFT